MTNESPSQEIKIPRGYEFAGAPPVELHDIFESLREGVFPPFDSLPLRITLNETLESFFQQELQYSLDNRRMETYKPLFYKPGFGIVAGQRGGRPDFGRTWIKLEKASKRTIRKYDFVVLGTVHPHAYDRPALLSRSDLIYFLGYSDYFSHLEDFLMAVVSEQNLMLVLKSLETGQGSISLDRHHDELKPYLLQLNMLSQREALAEIKKEKPEISGEELLSRSRPLEILNLDVRVAQDFNLGLYSSSKENPRVLERLLSAPISSI